MKIFKTASYKKLAQGNVDLLECEQCHDVINPWESGIDPNAPNAHQLRCQKCGGRYLVQEATALTENSVAPQVAQF
jgi:NAD-dependent SIR2 family protein deacetylase